jgi:DNA-directed RNA polymerase specialized sigma24 family protein
MAADVRDSTALLQLLVVLATVNTRSREVWVDHRLVGLSQRDLARREGVSSNRICQRVRSVDTAVLGALRP